MSAWNGTISPAAIRKYIAALPLNLTRENAKAAMLAKRIVSIVTTLDTRNELKYQRQTEPLENTFVYASNVILEPIQVTGISVVSASGFRDVARAHTRGISHRMASSVAMTNATIEPVERRGLPTLLGVRVVGSIRLRVSVTVLT
jgi:hypothetical protein